MIKNEIKNYGFQVPEITPDKGIGDKLGDKYENFISSVI